MRGREKKRVDMNNLIDRAVIEGFLTNGELLHKMPNYQSLSKRMRCKIPNWEHHLKTGN